MPVIAGKSSLDHVLRWDGDDLSGRSISSAGLDFAITDDCPASIPVFRKLIPDNQSNTLAGRDTGHTWRGR